MHRNPRFGDENTRIYSLSLKTQCENSDNDGLNDPFYFPKKTV